MTEEIDPKSVSFSQAQGYEPLPQPLKPEELSRAARVGIWNVLYSMVSNDARFNYGTLWTPILRLIHTHFSGRALDEWGQIERIGAEKTLSEAQGIIYGSPFNRVFDLLTFIMRINRCPQEFIEGIAFTFRRFQLAYVVDTTRPPTIYPISTPEEGDALVDALRQIDSTGLIGARKHLQDAGTCINQQDWAGAVRESIHAVESTARQIAPQTKTLGDALNVLEKMGLLEHVALKEGFRKIYGYTNDEQGIRHALLNQPSAHVGQDEALFMFGACASFASYLARKHLAIENRG